MNKKIKSDMSMNVVNDIAEEVADIYTQYVIEESIKSEVPLLTEQVESLNEDYFNRTVNNIVSYNTEEVFDFLLTMGRKDLVSRINDFCWGDICEC